MKASYESVGPFSAKLLYGIFQRKSGYSQGAKAMAHAGSFNYADFTKDVVDFTLSIVLYILYQIFSLGSLAYE